MPLLYPHSPPAVGDLVNQGSQCENCCDWFPEEKGTE